MIGLGPEQHTPSVEGYQMPSGVALRVSPADPSIPRPQMKRGARPAQEADPLPVLLNHIA